ncbi:hypothetical protein JVT61DRAFT_10110 [Boletus reticuloceps]|uniref:Derlin n=1 Tax=Boletus reticuloceps TaxID=495285 RepID=A0A8I2YXL7_9AGAM|nr:hypothetical protein JVT61DRAFT_10110 [Boletus reticuloceps]
MADIVAEINKIPPVTRFLVLSSLGVTIPAIVGFVSMHKLLFITHLITKKWEVWRAYTSLFFGIAFFASFVCLLFPTRGVLPAEIRTVLKPRIMNVVPRTMHGSFSSPPLGLSFLTVRLVPWSTIMPF